jgi:hypothetical protein
MDRGEEQIERLEHQRDFDPELIAVPGAQGCATARRSLVWKSLSLPAFAMGILMAGKKLTEDQAFDVLRVVLTGTG